MAPRYRAGKRLWEPHEDRLLCALYPHAPTALVARRIGRSPGSTYQRAQTLGLHKSAEYFASSQSGRLVRGDMRGAGSRFPKGHVPANKGLRRPGWGPGRMKATQFKPGTRLGAAQRNWKPIGSERVSKDGYLERKVRDDNPLGLSREEANRRRQRRWVPVHRLVWEEANGPLPPGHALVFKNGDKADIRIDNIEIITRRALMARNTVHNLPEALASTIQLLGALRRQLRKRDRHGHKEQDRRSA
jgi:hypothetical protein